MNNEQSAASIAASTKRYVVTFVHEADLQVGDTVVMVETPQFDNLLLRLSDMTLHDLADFNGQYVHLREYEA